MTKKIYFSKIEAETCFTAKIVSRADKIIEWVEQNRDKINNSKKANLEFSFKDNALTIRDENFEIIE